MKELPMSLELCFRFLDCFKRTEKSFIFIINHMSDVQIAILPFPLGPETVEQ